jgi:hypothetical protein
MSIFRKYVEKIKFLFESDKNNESLREDIYTFFIISRSFPLRTRNVSDKNCTKNQNTHFMFNNFFLKTYRLWDNVGKYLTVRQVTKDNTKRRMRFACWIINARYTNTHHVILIPFPHQQWLQESASVLHNIYVACLVNTKLHIHFRFISCSQAAP